MKRNNLCAVRYIWDVIRHFDNIVYPYSKISRLPSFFQTPALILRHILKRRLKYSYEFDGVATCHNLSLLDAPRFKFALSEAILAGGFDYFIYMRQHQAIWCAEKALSLHKPASFVELGTGKGYMMTTILSSLDFLGIDLNKIPVFLFDTFDSHATDNRGRQDESFGKNIYYAESFDQVRRNFSRFTNVRLVQGLLPMSLEDIQTGPIGFLHIDLNAPEIEIECLKLLWKEILPGGVVLIDDYAYRGYEYTNQLFNELAKELEVSILTTAYGQGIIVK